MPRALMHSPALDLKAISEASIQLQTLTARLPPDAVQAARIQTLRQQGRFVEMKYTEDHEWLRVEDDLVVVGITEHAATQLGDVVFVELPEVETQVAKGE